MIFNKLVFILESSDEKKLSNRAKFEFFIFKSLTIKVERKSFVKEFDLSQLSHFFVEFPDNSTELNLTTESSA